MSTQSEHTHLKSRRPRLKRVVGRIFIILAWTLMALVLTVAASLICMVRILTPERLTPLATTVANRYLDADVALGRAELSFHPAFPVLQLRLDSLTVISHAFDSIPQQWRQSMPAYADTLLTLDRMVASVDLGALGTRGEIAIGDVELVRPAVNIVLDRSGKGNFDIYHSTADTTDTDSTFLMPPISVRHFTMTEPRAIRYFDAIDSTGATVVLLARADLDGSGAPDYALHVEGRVNSPIARELLQLEGINVGVQGRMHWNPASPELLSVERLRLWGAFLEATVDARVSLGQTMRVDSAAFELSPVRIDSVVGLLDAAQRRKYHLEGPSFGTDLAIAASGRLTQPFVPALDTVPSAEIRIWAEPAVLRYGPMQLSDLSVDLTASTDGTDYDNTIIRLAQFTASGPATSITLSGTFGNVLTDPAFDCRLEGDVRLSKLPPALLQSIDGYLDGHLSVDLAATGRSSMFRLGRFHSLNVRGRALASDIYYLKADTSHYFTAGRARFMFGSQLAARDTASRANTLAAVLRVDTANALLGGVRLDLGNLNLGIGAENSGMTADTTRVIPLGGGIRVGNFRVISITDSAGMNLRGLHGVVTLKRHNGDAHLPEIRLDAGIDRLVAGAPAARFMLRKASLNAMTYLRPERRERRRELKHLADSISAVHPDLSPDSVLALAVARRRNRPHGPRRVRMQTDNDTELIQFDLTKGFRRYLSDWYLGGELTARRTALRTPYFPVRNRLKHLHLAFSNDSIVLDSVMCISGRSDLAVSGIISNMRWVLMGRRGATLKVNFAISSDTIDVNQLAAATFAGAAYADKMRKGMAPVDSSFTNEDSFDHELEEALVDADTIAPILVPTNIDANIAVRAKNILYSDLHMNNFSGDVMVYDGALNLNNLQAFSNAGDIELSALYSAPRTNEIRCGMGMKLNGFNIARFLNLMPAVDSIMPLMRDFAGTIDADLAATVDIDSTMNLVLPSLDAALHLNGSNLAFIDADTYRTLGKWLRFRDRADNRIKHMSVQLLVRDNVMQIYPFKFDIDRYTLGVVGSNDLAMNFDYHIAVLKSPLPFKFGITIKGNPDKYKIRLGGARFKADAVAESVNMVDTVRVNLVQQIQNVFRRGVSRSRFASLNPAALGDASAGVVEGGTLSTADSLMLERRGMAPDSVRIVPVETLERKRRNRK